jgi:hypothetical protein
MRAVKKILFPFFAIAALFGCQKEFSEENGLTPTSAQTIDSAWYVASSTLIKYVAPSGAFSDSTHESYYYDSGKIQIKRISHYPTSSPNYDSSLQTFHYDPSGKVLRYELNMAAYPHFTDVVSIDFVYTGNNVSQAVIKYRNGATNINYITTQTGTGGKVISFEDTTAVFPVYQPKVFNKSTFWYLPNGRLDSSATFTLNSEMYGLGLFRLDSVFNKYEYDALGNIAKHHNKWAEFDTVASPNALRFHSTTNFLTRDARGKEIADTYAKIFGNVQWFSVTEYSHFYYGLTNLGWGNLASYFSNTVCTQATSVTNYTSPLTLTDNKSGTFVPVFNGNNQLVQLDIPEAFSVSSGPFNTTGVIKLSYIKTRK